MSSHDSFVSTIIIPFLEFICESIFNLNNYLISNLSNLNTQIASITIFNHLVLKISSISLIICFIAISINLFDFFSSFNSNDLEFKKNNVTYLIVPSIISLLYSSIYVAVCFKIFNYCISLINPITSSFNNLEFNQNITSDSSEITIFIEIFVSGLLLLATLSLIKLFVIRYPHLIIILITHSYMSFSIARGNYDSIFSLLKKICTLNISLAFKLILYLYASKMFVNNNEFIYLVYGCGLLFLSIFSENIINNYLINETTTLNLLRKVKHV